jgi:hypothetical protein
LSNIIPYLVIHGGHITVRMRMLPMSKGWQTKKRQNIDGTKRRPSVISMIEMNNRIDIKKRTKVKKNFKHRNNVVVYNGLQASCATLEEDHQQKLLLDRQPCWGH